MAQRGKERRGGSIYSILLKLTAEKNWSHVLVFPLNAAPKRVLHPWLFVIRLPIPVQNWWTCLLCCFMDMWVVKSICSIAHLHQTCRSPTSPMVASWIFEGWTLRNCQRCLVSWLQKKYLSQYWIDVFGWAGMCWWNFTKVGVYVFETQPVPVTRSNQIDAS